MAELRKRGQATTVIFPLVDRGTLNLEGTPVTIASGDIQIMKDEGSFANTSTASFVDETGGLYSIPLTSAEMQASRIALKVVDQTGPKLWEDQIIIIDTESGPEIWASEITSKTSNSVFIIDEGPAVAAALLGATIMVVDASTGTSRSISTVTGYTVTTREVTVSPAFVDPATLAANDKVTFYPGVPAIGVAGAGLTDLGGMSTGMKGEVNAEVDTALDTTTHAEPGQGTPPATASIKDKIGYLYKFLRNRVTSDGTTISVYNDDATTVDHKSAHSDDGATYDRGEFTTGP